MKYPPVFMSALLSLSLLTASAQKNFQSAYYITNDNDTIHGEIDNRGDLRNGKLCSFRQGPGGEIRQLTPAEIAAYRFTDGKYYVSRTLVINDKSQRVFLEYLVNGITSLYYHRSTKGDHYFLENIPGELTELKNDDLLVEQDGKSYSRKSNRYIGQLKSSFSDAPQIQEELDHAVFSHKSLIDLTSDYHNYVCEDDQVCIIYEKKPPVVRIGFGPVLGFSTSGLQFVNFPSYDEYELKRSTDLLLGLRTIVTLPRINEKLSFLVQAEFNDSYFYGYKEDTRFSNSATYMDLHIHLKTMNAMLGLQYKYPKGRIRPTAAMGVLLSYNVAQDFKHVHEQVSETFVFTREFHETPLILENWGAFISLGAERKMKGNQHLGLDLRYHYSKEVIGTIVRRDGLSLSCGYYF